MDEARAKAAQFDGIKAFSKTSGIGKEIAETREAVRLLAKEEGAAQRAVKIATGAVEQQERALRQAHKSLNDFGVPITSITRHEEALRGTVARTTAAIEKQTRALKEQRTVAERPAPAAPVARRSLAPSVAASSLADRVNRTGRPTRTLGPLGGVVGAYSVAQGYKDAAKFDRRLTMIGQTADASRAEIDKMGAGLFELAQQTATPIDKLTGGLESLVAQGRSLKDGLAFLPSVARTAAASGSEVEDIAKTADSVSTNFGIAGKQMQSAFDIMVAGGKAGQFELKDMARYLPSLSPAASAVGMKAEKGLADVVAMLQTIRKGTGTTEEAATSLTNIFQKMESEETAKKFKKMGVDLEAAMAKGRKEGRNLIEVFEEAAQLATKGDLSKLPNLIADQEFGRGVRALLTYRGEWQKLSATLQSTSGGSVMRDLTQVTKDSQAAVDRLSNAFEHLKTSAARAGDSLGASKGMGQLGEEFQLVATAMERINKAYEAGGISGAFGQAVKDAKERIRQNDVEYADQDREAQVKRIKEMEESIAETRKTLAGKGYSQERIEGAVRSKTMQLAAEHRRLGDIAANRDALAPADKVPLRMGVDPTSPISGQPGAIGPGVAGFQEAFPLDLSKQPKKTTVPLPPRRPASLPTTIGSIDEVLGPKQVEVKPTLAPGAIEDLKSRFEIKPTFDAGSLAGAEAKLHEIGKQMDEMGQKTIAPQGDGSGLAPLGTAADEAKGKLSALDGITVSPTVNAASIAAANAAVLELIGNIGRVGPAMAAAGAAATAGAAKTGNVAQRLQNARTDTGM
nr:phage tail tape measure protein [Methylobacterium sp. OTU13CASTA1]